MDDGRMISTAGLMLGIEYSLILWTMIALAVHFLG